MDDSLVAARERCAAALHRMLAVRSLDYLPDPLLTGVLLMLPAHERARCSLLSKRWRDLVRSPASWRTIFIDKRAHTEEQLTTILLMARGQLQCLRFVFVCGTDYWRLPETFPDGGVITAALRRANCALLTELSFVIPPTAVTAEEAAANELTAAHAHGELGYLLTWKDMRYERSSTPSFSVNSLAELHVVCPSLRSVACDVGVCDDEGSLRTLSLLRFTGLKKLHVQLHGGLRVDEAPTSAFRAQEALPLISCLLSRNAFSELLLELVGERTALPLPAPPSDEVLAAFSGALAANTSLQSLRLDHVLGAILAADASHLADALKAAQALKTFVLDADLKSFRRIGQPAWPAEEDAEAAAAATTKTLQALSAALAADCALQRLKLCALPTIMQAGLPFLGAALASNTHLITLGLQSSLERDAYERLPDERLDSGALRPLATVLAESNRTLRFLGVRRCGIDDAAARVLADALSPGGCALLALILDENCIRSEGATAFARALFGNVTLAVLDLSGDPYERRWYPEGVPRPYNSVGDAGALAFAALLKSGWSALRELHLSENDIGDSGGAALAASLARNDHLRALLLARNSGLAARTVQALCEALPCNATLKTLDISDLEAAGASKLEQLVGALQRNSTLSRFHARNKHTGTYESGRWHAALRQHPTLRYEQLRFCTRRVRYSQQENSDTDEGDDEHKPDSYGYDY